ncbi:lipopolysaccharide kinase InaA family protein [Paludibacter sp. 221]|uniref:lipopolysaccharide kinase InaA family protein n=1 Tax=Paludibacter sp. 221 TaxID=2302939 RepID=UPI0013D33821|nr:lipopolysaccharide kinase InaA family protein [Paludibacter sp. 221]
MKIVINPKYKNLEPFVNSIPDTFTSAGETIYKARNELKTYSIQGMEVVVKSFKIPIVLNRIVYALFRPSKAKRSYEYAFKLLEKGVATPEPIAYIEEKRGGLLKRSYYVSVYEKEAEHIRLYMSGEKKDEKFIGELAKFIAGFHAKGIFHLDMSPGNILAKPNGDDFEFMLVDINRMNFREHISEKERYSSFRRLTDNFEVIKPLAEEYAACANMNREKTVEEIKKECYKFFGKSLE